MNNFLRRNPHLTQVHYAPGGGASLDSHTNYVYDSPTKKSQYASQTSTYDVPTVSLFDGLGRLVETDNYEGSNFIAGAIVSQVPGLTLAEVA